MQMGAVQGKLIEEMERDGIDLPDHIKNAPDLLVGLELFYNGFQELTTCRQLGMSLGPIPWTAIDQYCVRYDIDGMQREDMFFHVEALDDTYRNEVEKKASKKGKK